MKKTYLIISSLFLVILTLSLINAQDFCTNNSGCHVNICKTDSCTNVTIEKQNQIADWDTCEYPQMDSNKCLCIENKCIFTDSNNEDELLPTGPNPPFSCNCEEIIEDCTCEDLQFITEEVEVADIVFGDSGFKIKDQKWKENKLIIEFFVLIEQCDSKTIWPKGYTLTEDNLILRYQSEHSYTAGATDDDCVNIFTYEISGIEEKDYEISLIKLVPISEAEAMGGPEIGVHCDNFGLRRDIRYCSSSNQWEMQKDANKNCANNFECKSNICVDNQCVSMGLLKRIWNWFRRLFGG